MLRTDRGDWESSPWVCMLFFSFTAFSGDSRVDGRIPLFCLASHFCQRDNTLVFFLLLLAFVGGQGRAGLEPHQTCEWNATVLLANGDISGKMNTHAYME